MKFLVSQLPYKNYAYTILQSIKCVITLFPKNNVHILILKYFIDEKCKPSVESSEGCHLFFGEGSCLDVEGCRLIRLDLLTTGVAVAIS